MRRRHGATWLWTGKESLWQVTRPSCSRLRTEDSVPRSFRRRTASQIFPRFTRCSELRSSSIRLDVPILMTCRAAKALCQSVPVQSRCRLSQAKRQELQRQAFSAKQAACDFASQSEEDAHNGELLARLRHGVCAAVHGLRTNSSRQRQKCMRQEATSGRRARDVPASAVQHLAIVAELAHGYRCAHESAQCFAVGS